LGGLVFGFKAISFLVLFWPRVFWFFRKSVVVTRRDYEKFKKGKCPLRKTYSRFSLEIETVGGVWRYTEDAWAVLDADFGIEEVRRK